MYTYTVFKTLYIYPVSYMPVFFKKAKERAAFESEEINVCDKSGPHLDLQLQICKKTRIHVHVMIPFSFDRKRDFTCTCIACRIPRTCIRMCRVRCHSNVTCIYIHVYNVMHVRRYWIKTPKKKKSVSGLELEWVRNSFSLVTD